MKQIIPVSFSQFSVPELMDFIRRILTEDREALFFTYALKIPPFLRADDLKRNIPFRESLFQSRCISPDKLPYFREFRTCIREDQTHRTLQRIFPVGLADQKSQDGTVQAAAEGYIYLAVKVTMPLIDPFCGKRRF